MLPQQMSGSNKCGTGPSSDVVPGSLISISLFVCLSASTASLIFLQTEMVGVCKFNPPLVSLSRHSSAVPILLQLNIFSAFLPVSCACPLAALPALYAWPVFHHEEAALLTTAGWGSADSPLTTLYRNTVQGRKMHLTTGQYQFYALVAGSPAAIICQFNNETQWRWFVLSQSQTSVFLSFVRLDLRVRPGAQIRFQPLLYFVYSGLTFNTLSAPARIPCCVWCLNCLCALVQLMEAKRWNRLWTFFLLTTAGHSFLPPLSLFSLNGRYPNALKTDLHWFNIPVFSFFILERDFWVWSETVRLDF